MAGKHPPQTASDRVEAGFIRSKFRSTPAQMRYNTPGRLVHTILESRPYSPRRNTSRPYNNVGELLAIEGASTAKLKPHSRRQMLLPYRALSAKMSMPPSSIRCPGVFFPLPLREIRLEARLREHQIYAEACQRSSDLRGLTLSSEFGTGHEHSKATERMSDRALRVSRKST